MYIGAPCQVSSQYTCFWSQSAKLRRVHQIMLDLSYGSSSGSDSEEELEVHESLLDRLNDATEGTHEDAATPKRTLPSAGQIFADTDRPSFLSPEANKRLKTCTAHVKLQSKPQEEQMVAFAEPKKATKFNVKQMAPPLKGTPATQAVFSAPAQPSKLASKSSSSQPIPTDALIAMMGGQARNDNVKSNKSTPAMKVDDFLAQPSGHQLPRQKQDRKAREKSKRQMGQSSHSHWKSEAEMVLRQQYDT